MLAFAQQQQDVQLAEQYFSNGEYDKAVVLYEKLQSKNPGNSQFYQNYFKCLTELKQFDEAEKMIRKQIKKFPDDLSYYVDLGNTYHLQENEKQATAQYDEAIKLIAPNMPQINKLANRFISNGLIDYGIETYQQARKIFNAQNSDLYLNELAGLYRRNGNVSATIKTYIDILQSDPAQKEQVQTDLQPLIEDAQYSKELQSELYRRIQKNPEVEQLNDMLVWYYIQKKDFTSAFQQVKALDKRNKEEGQRIYQFAQSAFDEGNYDAAIGAYKYLISEKGKSSFLYLPSRSNILTAQQTKITIFNNYTNDDLLKLEKDYEDFLIEFGKGPQTLSVIRDFANFEAKYLHNADKAIALLQEAVSIPTPNNKLNASLKLDLGDAQLIKSEVWESLLLYGQVDKAFKDDELGEKARFKNAKLSFYMGDFDWSQTQLDVLKSATSELVANDAISLSVFITDNMGLDTTPEPMKIYARADLLIFQNRNEEAIKTLDSLTNNYPNHSLNDDVLFEKGRIYLSERKYTEAAQLFDKIDESYSFDILGDDAMFQLAELYENYLLDNNKAMELYKEILTKYKGSIYTVEARKRYRALRGDQLN